MSWETARFEMLRNEGWVRSLSGTSSPPPPASLRLFCKTLQSGLYEPIRNELDSFVLTIPLISLGYLQYLDEFFYTQHDHCLGHPFRFPESLYTDPIWRSRYHCPVAVGSVVYILHYYLQSSLTPQTPHTPHFLFQSINLHTRVTTYLPPPSSPKRVFAKAIALCRKIFFFETVAYDSINKVPQIFGEVFDTATNEWSILRNPPDFKLDQHEITPDMFIASLGVTQGKLMVYYHPNPPNLEPCAKIFLYDVIKDVWETHPCDVWPIHDGYINPDNEPRVLGTEIIREDNSTLYWINEKHHICAFDWKAKQYYDGPILGMEHKMEKSFTSLVTMVHVWLDFFCLIWSTTSTTTEATIEYHFTYLRVTKNILNKTLLGFVVGCGLFPFHHGCHLYYAIKL